MPANGFYKTVLRVLNAHNLILFRVNSFLNIFTKNILKQVNYEWSKNFQFYKRDQRTLFWRNVYKIIIIFLHLAYSLKSVFILSNPIN